MAENIDVAVLIIKVSDGWTCKVKCVWIGSETGCHTNFPLVADIVKIGTG